MMTYANARADSHGFVGSSDVPALMATDKVLYVERGGGRVYQYGYDYESDGFVSRDLTVFADHVLADGGGCRGLLLCVSRSRGRCLCAGTGRWR
ncbi:hypothetical protein M5E88_13025 [Akkermansia muciniphila]|nr:hypothetical protein M5E88_13025 [Akkermansia muciniphila]